MRSSLFLRRTALFMALCFAWSFILATSTRAATYHEPVPPGRTRHLSAAEMKHIVGGSTVLGGDPDSTGDTTANVGASPGSAYPWEGSVGDVKTDNGNKLTAVHIVGWQQRGGLPVAVSLYHNSLSDATNKNLHFYNGLSAKWTTSYDVSLVQNTSTQNVTIFWGDGRSYTFAHNVGGTFTAPAGVYDTLTVNSGNSSFDLKTKDQNIYRFLNWGSNSTAIYHYLNKIIDENGNTITINRGSGAQLQSVFDATNRSVVFYYDGSNRLSSIVDPLNHTWTFSYDTSSRVSQVNFPTVSGNSYNMLFGYDSHNNINSIRDRRLNTSTYSYNADSTIQWEQSAANNKTTFTYGKDLDNNVNSSAVTITAPNLVKTTHFYDTYGHLVQVEDAQHYSTLFPSSSFDADNNAQTVQDPRGYSHSFSYDGNGNLLSATLPPTPENGSGNKVSFTYNSHNKPTLIQTQLVRKVIVTYDPNDNVTQVDNYNGGGTLLARTKLTIGTYGLVSDKTDADSHKTLYGYDGNGYLNSVTTPLGKQTQWTYNALGVATSRVDASNVMTTYTPDEWSRITNVSYSADVYYDHDGQKTYTYDPNDNLTGFANAAGSFTRTYDVDNRMTEEDRDGVLQVKHTYDATGQAGMLSQTFDVDNTPITYAYTTRNQLLSVSEYSNATNYAYDAAGNEQTINDPNGNYATKAWDAAGRISSLVNKLPSGTYLSGYAYLYTKDSQKSQVTETGYGNTAYATESWGYDGIGHLYTDSRTGTSPFSATYTVDGVGNRTSQTVNGTSSTLSYDSDDEITGTSSGNVYQYDTNGDQNGRKVGGAWSYPYYTNEGQVAVIYGATPDKYDWFLYDALGRQITRKDASGASPITTTYQYDGDSVLTEQQSGTTVSRYLSGTNLLLKYGIGGNETAQMDGLGSMRQGVDPSTGNFTGKLDFDPFGNMIGGTGTARSAYQWQAQSGYRSDGDIGGLLKVGYRYYDPQVGRFTSRDSDLSPYAVNSPVEAIGFQIIAAVQSKMSPQDERPDFVQTSLGSLSLQPVQSMNTMDGEHSQNAYVYCFADPVNFTDVSGHAAVVVVLVVLIIICGVIIGYILVRQIINIAHNLRRAIGKGSL